MDPTAEALIVLAHLSLAACALIAVGVAAKFAWTTRRVLKSNRELLRQLAERLKAAERPYLDLGLRVQEGRVVLQLRNAGRSMARRVRLLLDRSVFVSADPDCRERLNDAFAFRHGLASLAPGAELSFSLMPLDSVSEHDEPFRVIALYATEHDEYAETTELDPRQLLRARSSRALKGSS